MPTLTVRGLDADLYEDLKEVARASDSSMEATVRQMLREAVRRRKRWVGARLADLSGPAELADLETPFVRCADLPRDVVLS